MGRGSWEDDWNRATTTCRSPFPSFPSFPLPGDSAQDGQDVVLAHDLVFDAFELVRAARVLALDDLVADLDLGRARLAVVQRLAFTARDHFTLGRLFLGVVGGEDAARGGSDERRVGKEGKSTS